MLWHRPRTISVKNVEAFQYMADKLQPLRGGYEVFSCPHCVSPLASYGFTDFWNFIMKTGTKSCLLNVYWHRLIHVHKLISGLLVMAMLSHKTEKGIFCHRFFLLESAKSMSVLPFLMESSDYNMWDPGVDDLILVISTKPSRDLQEFRRAFNSWEERCQLSFELIRPGRHGGR